MWSYAVTAIGKMFSAFFQWRTSEAGHKSESEVIKDKKDYKKATNVAERIFEVTDKYLPQMSKYDYWKYERLCRLFRKYN